MNATQKPKESQKKSVLSALLRWGLAIVLLTWVIRSGKLSLSDLAWFRQYPLKAFSLYLLEFGVCIFSMVRWWTLLRALDFKISLGSAIRLGMLGQFFSTVLPGTVSGDLVKAVYLARRNPSQKARSVMTLVVDRLSGLTAVIFLGTLGFIFGYQKLATLPGTHVELIRSFGFLVSSIGSVLFVALLSFPWVAKKLPRQLPKIVQALPKSQILQQLYEGVIDYRNRPFALWLAVGMSMVLQLVNVCLLWMVATIIFGPTPWGTLEPSTFVLAFILGVCAMQIPLAPMGLGLGQMVFAPIFLAMGAPSATFGPALITSLQLFQIFINLFGAIFFATYKNEVDEPVNLAEAVG